MSIYGKKWHERKPVYGSLEEIRMLEIKRNHEPDENYFTILVKRIEEYDPEGKIAHELAKKYHKR